MLLLMVMVTCVSMFALKDESYLRQTLQRQSATLHQAAVSYTVSHQQYTHYTLQLVISFSICTDACRR